MSQEIELKLALGPNGPTMLRRHPQLAGLDSVAQRLGNTYFDTPQGDLEAARMALRLRRIDGRVLQTLKTRGEGGGGLSTRGEWEWEVSGPGLDLEGLAELPPAALGRHVLERLAPRFTTDFHRETRMIDHDGARIEVALDEGEIAILVVVNVHGRAPGTSMKEGVSADGHPPRLARDWARGIG